jgi:hypothetical protein
VEVGIALQDRDWISTQQVKKHFGKQNKRRCPMSEQKGAYAHGTLPGLKELFAHKEQPVSVGNAGKWVKVYFTKEQYDEWKHGNGRAIGYLEEEVIKLKELENEGNDCGLKSDPVNHMTKVSPSRISNIGWSHFGVYVT